MAQNSTVGPFTGGISGAQEKQSTCIARGTSTSWKAGRAGESPGNAARVVPFGLEGARLHLSCTPTPPAAGEDEEIASTEHVLPHPELL